MSNISTPLALASCLPVAGPIIGFLIQTETQEARPTYAFNASVGSALTIITAVALAALNYFFTAGLLLGFGVVSFIHFVQAYNRADNAIEDAVQTQADQFFRGTEHILPSENDFGRL